MKRLYYALIGAALVLIGCQTGQPTPAPIQTKLTTATIEAIHTPTEASSAAPAPQATSTWTPEPAVAPELPTATITPTPSVTSTTVPTPTVISDVWANAPEGLNLRAEPSVTAALITSLDFGTHLVTLEGRFGPGADGKTWQNVCADGGRIGWVSVEFLLPTKPAGAASTVAPAVSAVSVVPRDVWVNAENGLNLRAQASVSSTLVTVLPFGQHLAKMGCGTLPDASSIAWLGVRADDDQTGWVSADFLSATNPVAASVAQSASGITPTLTVTVTTTSEVWVNAENGLNLREQANAQAKLLTVLKTAQHLTAIGMPTLPDAGGTRWQQVRTDDGKTGWVAAEYLSTTQPTISPTPTMTQVP